MWSRIHLIPMLQAEEDRDLVRRTWADKARERELLGSETRVYHSDRCVIWRIFSLAFSSLWGRRDGEIGCSRLPTRLVKIVAGRGVLF